MPEGKTESRGRTFPPDDPLLKLPETKHGAYLLDSLSELGFARQGPEPIDYQEMKAWADLTDTSLTPWESETLRMLSESYVVQLHRSKDANAAPPYDERSLGEMRKRSNDTFKRLWKQAGGKPRG